jgi:peroxiredoxin (alkyl hydroperoxide reductase subunit C)
MDLYNQNSRASLPHLGSKAPDFTAKTTQGTMKLSDFRGKWVVLFSHPADFTPVCTTEFIAFAQYSSYFAQRNAQLMGLSVDNTSSHLAWIHKIYENTGIEIPFPLIEDISMKISNLYGMISPTVSDTETVRTVFIIDDNQIIRAMLYYPMSIGRNIPEIIRMIDALQLVDKENVLTPANWIPGQPAVIPPPKTYQQLKERIKNKENYPCVDWYLSFKTINKSKPMEEEE